MSTAAIIPFQPQLPQVLPTIEGNVDYRDYRDQLLRIDHLLVHSGLEAQLLEQDLQQWLGGRTHTSARAQQNRQLHAQRALRCNIGRRLHDEDLRGFAARLADSPLLQFFCRLSAVDRITVPSKSALQRYEQWWPETEVRHLLQQLLRQGAEQPQSLHLPEVIDLESAFLDTTCLAAPIHYPVDWVLLRDGTRTLIKALELIRAQGLKHRMPQPATFLRQINTLCMQMTHAGRQTDSQRRRKQTLRQMDRVVDTVRNHARRYRALLAERWSQTQWTQAQAQQVLGRMDNVLAQLPQARRQARQRILAGQPVADAEKILSLYEPDVHVIVRRKAGAQVEFGNSLLLAENPQGLILEWELFRQRAPADTELLPRTIQKLQTAYGPRLRAVAADRGFDNALNQVGLAQKQIYNGVCPRSPQQLRQRLGGWKFKRLQRRRAQTEGRIGIFKQAFGAGHLRNKGFVHRQLTVTWTVLVHNLWVLARLQRAATAAPAQAAA